MITLSGQHAVASNLRQIASAVPQKAAGALFRRAELLMGDSKEHYVPVDTGALRNSGHVQLPVIEGTDIAVTMGFGGPSVPYALRQHEDLSYHHDVGEAKYLEKPLMSAQATFAADMAADLKL